jgi:hypothetical protein
MPDVAARCEPANILAINPDRISFMVTITAGYGGIHVSKV